MSIQIENLADHVDAIPLLAVWLYGEHWHREQHDSMGSIVSELATHLDPNAIPMTLLAIVNGRVLGTVSLVLDDPRNTFQPGPWLSMLYVNEEQRRQGMGSALVHAAEIRAGVLGKQELYLCTLCPSFYERLGWSVIDQQQSQDTQVITTMHRMLST